MASDDVLDPIPIADLKEGEMNVRVLPNGKKAIFIRKGDDVRVFGEVCPHLGADLTEGRYCANTHTVHCKWHGYVFSADDGVFQENPNERFMRLIRTPTEHFKPEKTPRYKLPMLKATVREGRVFIGQRHGSAEGANESTEETHTGAAT